METEIHKGSFYQIAKFDLGLTPFKLIYVQRLTREDEQKIIERERDRETEREREKPIVLLDTC